MDYKGILLAGGSGTRLHPMTSVVSKQLLPIYDKPMIYYPLSILMLAGIKDVLIITRPEDQATFNNLLGDGSQWGLRIEYKTQLKPEGIAQGLLLGEEFLSDSGCVFILGDNIFYGAGMSSFLQSAIKKNSGATIFSYAVSDPERYGVVEFDDKNEISKLIEKPSKPPSNQAVTGLYILDNTASIRTKLVKKSARGELEIVDLLNMYLADRQLECAKFQRGVAWLDTGTPESLLEASLFVETVEKRQGYKIACLEEIALLNNWISVSKIESIINTNPSSPVSTYLKGLIAR
ncbi:glucose-1-phosphate thymidylyltransferase RfbA [Alphaproteobacteria bacterium]|nr:glucose-1-phosphate thymidylyltransferase RfbA [Alphaproteobacteria bacterium]